MPHIRIESFCRPEFPASRGETRFLWYADNVEHPGEGLLGVEVDGIPFLLQVKPKGENVLLKAEKISRPSPNRLIKQALHDYIDLTGVTVLHENISNFQEAKLVKPNDALLEIDRFDADNLPDKPLWIEVGFGSGRHLLHQAAAHPDVHLIGLEIHRPSLEQVMRRIELEGLSNVQVIDYDARLFMELLPSDRVERIFVHFPVPWDKKPHRRVISDSFVAESMRVLKPGGTLELRTDSENYFRYSMEVFTRPRRMRLTLEKNGEAAVRSKYEDRWRRLNKNIYEIHLQCLESSPPKRIDRDFSIPCAPTISAVTAAKPAKAMIEGDHFVHIERIYAIDEKSGLIRLSFGSFDRPEHKYILIQEGGARYYPHDPVATRTNRNAHEKVKEWLCRVS